MDRRRQLNEFYELLDEAIKKFPLRPLRELTRNNIPTHVVYYFFDKEQERENGEQLKVIRVGTHAARKKSNAIAYGRLNQHRGTLDGYGSHRGSVFRKLVGLGLINKDSLSLVSWGRENSKCFDELEIEKAVSDYLGSLLFTVIEIPGPSQKNNERAFIEKKSIALLSNYIGPAIDQPLDTWLGHYTGMNRISKSGLWNSDFVDYPLPDISFLKRLETILWRMRNYY